MSEPEFLSRPDGARIACCRIPGQLPGVLFLGGFLSDMTGTKATFLENWCLGRGHAFVRFDYRGHGESSGRFEDGTIGAWTDDALAVLDQRTEGRQILVGSSMGGWIALLVARMRPERIAGLVGVAAAPDFTRRLWQHDLGPEQRASIEREGQVRIPSAYDENGYVITRNLLHEAEAHILLDGPLPLTAPLRLVHGLRDNDVPWETSLRILERVESEDASLILVRDGDHRLSGARDLDRLGRILGELVSCQPDSSARI